MTVIDRKTIDFLLFDLLMVDQLCEHGRYAEHDREGLLSVLDLAEKIAIERLWPHAARSDIEEPVLVDGEVRILPEAKNALEMLREAGFFSAHCDYEQGGMQLPITVAHACNGMFKGANVSTHAYMSLTRAAANLIATHGSPEQKRLLLEPMLEGRFFGTMCLSEPGAGSSLVDIRARAEPLADGTWSLTGNKMWISAGDHDAAENIIHLVLARTPGAPAGVKGISLFAVPKFHLDNDGRPGARNGVAVGGLNHKMGYRGVSNCLLSFGETEPAIGTLVGDENRGLITMFHMMNEARISVGIGAAMLGSVGYRISLDYAKERRQGRSLDQKDPASPPMAIIDHPDVRRMLLCQKAWTEGALALCLYADSLADRRALASGEEFERLSMLLDVVTPVVKAWPSEFGLEANKLAIQVLGGYGYTRDFPVERLYRDNRLNMIHEGTNGIQALDLLARKVQNDDGRGLGLLLAELRSGLDLVREDPQFAADVAKLETLLDAVVRQAWETGALMAAGEASRALAFATLFLHAMGHLLVGWLWLRQAAIATAKSKSDGADRAFLEAKIVTSRFFFDTELPRAETWLRTMSSGSAAFLSCGTEGL